MKLSVEEKKALWNAPHRAIVFKVVDKLTTSRANEVVSAACGVIGEDHGVDALPVWIHFDYIDTSETWFPLGISISDDDQVVKDVVMTIQEIVGYTRRSVDYNALTSPKTRKVNKVSKSAKTVVKFQPIRDPNKLPPGLRFFACDEAIAEAEYIGRILDDQTHRIGTIDRVRIKKWTTWFIEEGMSSHEYIDGLDKFLKGRLRSVIKLIGERYDDVPIFERRCLFQALESAQVLAIDRLIGDVEDAAAGGPGAARHIPTTSYGDRMTAIAHR